MNKIEKKCLNVIADLNENDQNSVLSFAEFLLDKARQEGRLVVAEKPLNIPRPEKERVVAAIKRLSETYPMIKKNTMLDETALLMSAHILKGRAATEVIDELQVLFEKHYDKFCQQNEQSS